MMYNKARQLTTNIMLKKIAYLVIILVGFYILLQIPAVKEYADGLKDKVLEKRDNVTEEYDRVKDKVDGVTDKAIEIKEDVEDTVDAVSDTVDAIGETADKIGDLVGGDDEEDVEEVADVEEDAEEISGITCTVEEKDADVCPDNYAPVCGDDGVTYGNACNGCSSGNIDTYVMGECSVKRSQ